MLTIRPHNAWCPAAVVIGLVLEQKAGNHPARPTIVGTGDIVSDLINNLGDRGKGNPQCGNNTCANTTLKQLRTTNYAQRDRLSCVQ